MNIENISLTVHGMSCHHCADTIRRSVESMEGVERVNVHLTEKKVDVTYDGDKIDPDTIRVRIKGEGFDVKD